MEVIVSGGAGFIGSNFVDLALEQNWYSKIYVIDALRYAGRKENVPTDNRVEFLVTDLSDVTPDLLEKCEFYFNFAAETHVDNSIENSLVFSENNYISVHKLLEKIRNSNSNIRLVQISTDEVYGHIFEGSFDEYDRLNPRNPYSATKAAAEMLVNGYVETYGLDAIITRSSNNYGKKQHPEKLLPKMIFNFLSNKPIGLYGAGDQVRDWTYVEDNCSGVELASRKLKKGEILNISANEELTNLEISSKILKIMNLEGRREDLITFVDDRLGHDFRYSISTQRIRDLGWKPQTPLDEGLSKTIEWFQSKPNK
jgi:dTDP-glucose 4,6-dehydratase